MSQIISCALSPNVEFDDVKEATKILCTPSTWRETKGISWVDQWFRDQYPDHVGYSFNSGRTALFLLLKSFGIQAGDEVLVQAYTCVAVPNAVLWCGAKPVYVDIDSTYNMSPQDATHKITKNTRAIIVQHTFGIPANMKKLAPFVKKNKLILIEDCAHSLGATVDDNKIGSFGDGACFSFGRDKVVSSVWGGYAIIGKRNSEARANLQKYHDSAPKPSAWWICQQLLHPIIFWFILPVYQIGIGKVVLFILLRLGIVSKPIDPIELEGGHPQMFPQQYPNALAVLLVRQLRKLPMRLAQRRRTTEVYRQRISDGFAAFRGQPTWLRYPVMTKDPLRMYQRFKNNGILLGRWYQQVIDPANVNLAHIWYVQGSCPKAEKAAKQSINFPTQITEIQAARVLSVYENASH